MSALPHDPVDRRLLDDWQRDFPLIPRPFAAIGAALGLTEAQVLARLSDLAASGAIGRIGAVCRPNTLAASTLAAMRVPEGRVAEVAALIGREPGVNHSYLREDGWNLWFVATAPHRAGVNAALARIGRAAGLAVLDLRLVTPYHLDLGFPLDGGPRQKRPCRAVDMRAIAPGDPMLAEALSRGLDLTARPFRALGARLGWTETRVIERLRILAGAGILTRIGVILRHRRLGWHANAMTVWNVASERIDAVGGILAAQPGVTLCYRRRPDVRRWPWTLYCMVHGRSRDETLAALDRAEAAAGLAAQPRKVLFSRRCFRQQGATIAAPERVPA